MYNHATNLNPDYALAYCNKGSKKIYIGFALNLLENFYEAIAIS